MQTNPLTSFLTADKYRFTRRKAVKHLDLFGYVKIIQLLFGFDPHLSAVPTKAFSLLTADERR